MLYSRMFLFILPKCIVGIYSFQTPSLSWNLSPLPWPSQLCSLCTWVCSCFINRFICTMCFFFKDFYYFLLYLVYNVMSVSAGQQSDPVIHSSIYSYIHSYIYSFIYINSFPHIRHHVPSQ